METRINEQDEFLLSRLLDDDLAPDEAAALRERMEREPALESAFESMRRVDALLQKRQADQAVVDWDRFHGAVMNAVDEDAAGSPPVIKLSRWLGIGVPLAAAAAIALIVTLYRGEPDSQSTGPGPVAQHGTGTNDAMVSKTEVRPKQDEPDADPIIVAFKQPRRSKTESDAKVEVQFARSETLARTIREQDRNRQERELTTVVTQNEGPTLEEQLAALVAAMPPS